MQQSDDIKYYLGILRRRYLVFVGTFLAIFGVSFIVVIKLPPIYRSEAKILVESQQIPSDLVRSTVTGLAAERIEVTRQRITAREALLAIADKYSLFLEERKKLSVSQLVDLMRNRILILPFDLALTGRRSRDGALSVAFIVGFEYERPEIAAKVANELVTLILTEDIRSRTNRASETTQFLVREADRLQTELTKIDATLSDFKLQNKEALPERVPFQMSALERAEQGLKNLEQESVNLSESKRLLELETSVRKAAQFDDPRGLTDPMRKLELLQSELSSKSTIFSNSHPEIRALKKQIDAVLNEIEPAAKGNVDAADKIPEGVKRLDLNLRIVTEKIDRIDRQLKFNEAQKSALVKSISAINAILNQAPEVQVNVALIERQRDGLQKSLEEISGKLAEARLGEQLEKDQQAERFQVIEQPITPQDPVRPNRPKMLVLGFIFASLAGAGSVLGLEMLNQSIRVSNDVFKALGRYPLVVVPYIHTLEEGRRKVSRRLVLFITAFVFGLLGLLAVHFLYMPLDLLIVKVLQRLEL